MKILLHQFFCCVLTFLMFPLAAQQRPNIIVIMADDLGFSDIGSYGSEIKTPNLDRLAANGMRFSNFYNTGRCCPSRASLMTGLYAHQTGMGWMTRADMGELGYRGNLNNHGITIAEALRQQDYKCYMTGKWHLTKDSEMHNEGDKSSWPMQRGFDKFYGHLAGGGGYFNVSTLTFKNTIIPTPDNFYLTNAVTDSTISFLREHLDKESDKPFFFYVAYYPPHRPLHALQSDIDKYRGKYDEGWEVIRQKRFQSILAQGILSSDTKLTSQDPGIPRWDSLDAGQKKMWSAFMEVYAAQISSMDSGIGKIIDVLEAHKIMDNTVIIFLSDNGGNAEVEGSTSPSQDLSLVGQTFQSYHKEWAQVSNTPFRYYKSFVHEGGIASPLIVHWPAGLNKKGSVNSKLSHIIDIMPTCLSLTGSAYPEEYNGFKLYPLSGESLFNSDGSVGGRRNAVFFEHEANRAVIDYPWKLVSLRKNTPPYTGTWELYNLRKDRSESRNLADHRKKKVKQLEQAYQNWAGNHNVNPINGMTWDERVKTFVE